MNPTSRLAAVERACADLRRDGHTVTFTAIAAATGISRTSLYREPDIRAVIPVHLYGGMADIERIVQLARARDAAVVEDAAQAHGARFKGRRAGSFGDVATFSFFPGKNLGALGDAGALVTSNATIAARVAAVRDHGRREKYLHDFFGRNSRLFPTPRVTSNRPFRNKDIA